jgi:hypothetical protein
VAQQNQQETLERQEQQGSPELLPPYPESANVNVNSQTDAPSADSKSSPTGSDESAAAHNFENALNEFHYRMYL